MEDKKLEETLKGIYNSLTDEQKEKVKACKSSEEIMELVSKEGIELPEELMDKVAGGKLSSVFESIAAVIRFFES